MTRHTTFWLILLASLLSLFNALKPLTVDDPIYLCYATHIVHHPSDPYGFVLFGVDSANHTLVPPVVPYYLAGVLSLTGDHPFVWKLAFFPFTLLFVFSLHHLFRRFAAGLELPLTLMLALSPAFLPAWNLMLDLPALALALAALVLFFHAVDRSSLGLVLLAGLVVGVALQTKYTAFVAVAVMLAYGLLSRRFAYGLFAAALALLIFASWEGYTAYQYGEAHFLVSVEQRSGGLLRKSHLILALLATLGGLGAGVGLLSLAALGASWRLLLLGALVVALGFAVVTAVPEAQQAITRAPDGAARVSLNGLIFGLFGAVMILTALAVCGRLWQGNGAPTTFRVEGFLLCWLALETAGYFALSPFPAARRVLGVIVIGTLLSGRLAAQTCATAERRRLVYLPVLVSVLLGLGYYAVDFREAQVQAKIVQRAARHIQRRDPQALIWYAGSQGFTYYAEHAGMARLAPGVVPPPGSWCVTDGSSFEEERCFFADHVLAEVLQVRDALPLRTQLCYYGCGSPLEHLSGPRAEVHIYHRKKASP